MSIDSTSPPIIRGEVESTAFLRVRPVVLDELLPGRLEHAGWKALVALPLVGTRANVVEGAPRWFRQLAQAPELTADDRADALDLFLKLLSGRLDGVNIHALLRGE